MLFIKRVVARRCFKMLHEMTVAVEIFGYNLTYWRVFRAFILNIKRCCTNSKHISGAKYCGNATFNIGVRIYTNAFFFYFLRTEKNKNLWGINRCCLYIQLNFQASFNMGDKRRKREVADITYRVKMNKLVTNT